MQASITQGKYEPLYDVDPRTGATIEIFFAERVLTGMQGLGWFWWSSEPGGVPQWPPHGPFATSYGAYRDAMRNALLPSLTQGACARKIRS